MNRIYFYKMTVDNGGAPHATDDLLSLAICKPVMRRTASPGDLILGFAANALRDDNALIYAARVTEKLDGRDYYSSKHAGRGDCIYEWRGDEFVRRAGARYHEEPDLPHDLGHGPAYQNSSVLLCDDFAYFGRNASDDYKARYPVIEAAVRALGRGHRVEHAEALQAALRALADEVRATRQGVHGSPTQAASCGVCLREEEVCVVHDNEVQTHC